MKARQILMPIAYHPKHHDESNEGPTASVAALFKGTTLHIPLTESRFDSLLVKFRYRNFTSSVLLYKQYRDSAITEAKWKEGPRDLSAYSFAVRHMERLQKKTEPKGIMPIAIEILYSYDYGDGWEVAISLVREFEKDNQIVDDETATKVIADCKPICIAKDGLHVLDDCGKVG